MVSSDRVALKMRADLDEQEQGFMRPQLPRQQDSSDFSTEDLPPARLLSGVFEAAVTNNQHCRLGSQAALFGITSTKISCATQAVDWASL